MPAGIRAGGANDGYITVGGTDRLGINSAGTVQVFATTQSTNVNSGALTVAGGVGITGNIFNGGNITSSGAIAGTSLTVSGATVNGNLTVDGNLTVTGIVDSPSFLYQVVTSNTAVPDSDRKYIVISTSAITLTLPANPSNGRAYIIVDGANFSSFNCTVARNGRTIGGLAENLIIDQSAARVELVYYNGDWKVFAL